MNPSITNLQDNQMLKFAIVMVASVVTAVTASTFIIMSLLGGQGAHAMTTQNNNTQSGAVASMCVDPALVKAPATPESSSTSDDSMSPLVTPKVSGVSVRPLLSGSMSGSFNTTNSNATTTITTNTFNTTTTTIKDNGNSYSASWNNGNTFTYAPTTNTSQNNGNTNNQNNGNSSATTSTVNTTTNTTTNTSQNNGNTTENNPTTTTTTTTNTSQNNGNQDNDNNGNTYSAEASIF